MPSPDDALTLFESPPPKPRQWLLASNNQDLNRDGRKIYVWSLPAWVVTLGPGRTVNTCPEASACARLCYATDRASSYKRFPGVVESHRRNLLMVLDTPELWEQWMIAELRHHRYADADVRIHDAGDFYDGPYTRAWMRIMRSAPRTRFYAYTKAVSRFREIVEPDPPANFSYRFSLGGREDHLIDRARDRHADVFPTVAALESAGYLDQAASDLLAAGPEIRVGMAVNRPLKELGDRSFGEAQRERDAKLAAKRRRHSPAPAEQSA